jgi:hypothetical protein
MCFIDFAAPVDWEAVSYIATAISTVVAIIGFGAVTYQILQARKSSDLEGIQSFFSGITLREHEFITATICDNKTKSFNELVNYFEVYALAINKKLLPKASRDLVIDKLIEGIALIHVDATWLTSYQSAKITPNTFCELEKFTNKYKKKIEAHKLRFQPPLTEVKSS